MKPTRIEPPEFFAALTGALLRKGPVTLEVPPPGDHPPSLYRCSAIIVEAEGEQAAGGMRPRRVLLEVDGPACRLDPSPAGSQLEELSRRLLDQLDRSGVTDLYAPHPKDGETPLGRRIREVREELYRRTAAGECPDICYPCGKPYLKSEGKKCGCAP